MLMSLSLAHLERTTRLTKHPPTRTHRIMAEIRVLHQWIQIHQMLTSRVQACMAGNLAMIGNQLMLSRCKFIKGQPLRSQETLKLAVDLVRVALPILGPRMLVTTSSARQLARVLSARSSSVSTSLQTRRWVFKFPYFWLLPVGRC